MRKQSLFVKLYLSAMLVFFASIGANAQVTIGSDNPPSQWSLLDLNENADGTSSRALHLPRLDNDAREALTPNADAQGLMIFNTETRCLEFWNSTEWISLCDDVPHPVRCGTGGVATRMRIGENYYYTHEFMTDGVMRCWMVQNLNQGTIGGSSNGIWQHDIATNRNRGLYFGWSAAQTACPPGWSLPTASEMQDIQSVLTALPISDTSPRRFWHTAPYALAGVRDSNGWHSWGGLGAWWNSSILQVFVVNSNGTMDINSGTSSLSLSVRCIQDLE